MRTIGAVRDSIGTCVRTSGPQYNRALQDLINHTARLIGFNVEFGRYQGVQGHGIWWPDAFALVAEVKTTDAYAIKTAPLIGYADPLISDKRIPNWFQALARYVVGTPHGHSSSPCQIPEIAPLPVDRESERRAPLCGRPITYSRMVGRPDGFALDRVPLPDSDEFHLLTEGCEIAVRHA